MAKGLNETKGIFCLETHEWFSHEEMEGKIDNTSVEPSLMLLERMAGYNVPYRRRDVATRTEFEYFLEKYFDEGHEDYPILYLSFHGHGPENDRLPGLTLGDGTDYSLDDLESLIKGRCKGRVIHFGACGVMKAGSDRLQLFLDNSGAAAVCGYKKDVDWLESAAFDVLLMGYLRCAAFRKNSLQKTFRDLRECALVLSERLGFEVKPDPDTN